MTFRTASTIWEASHRYILRHILNLHHDASRCTAAWLRWCVPDQQGERVLPWGLFSSLRLPCEGGSVSSLPPVPVGLSSGEESGGELASSSRAWSFNRDPCRQKQNMPARSRQNGWDGWRENWASWLVLDEAMESWNAAAVSLSQTQHSALPLLLLTCVSERGCVDVLRSYECCSSSPYHRLDYSWSGG